VQCAQKRFEWIMSRRTLEENKSMEEQNRDAVTTGTATGVEEAQSEPIAPVETSNTSEELERVKAEEEASGLQANDGLWWKVLFHK